MTSRRSVEVAAEPRALFAMTQDYGRRLDRDPFQKDARLLGGATGAGPGAVARCTARNGFVLETRYVSFHAPGVCAVEMTRGPWFFRSFAGSWRFEPAGPGRTTVSFTDALVARPRLFTRVLAFIFDRETRGRLDALKRVAAGPLTPVATGTAHPDGGRNGRPRPVGSSGLEGRAGGA